MSKNWYGAIGAAIGAVIGAMIGRTIWPEQAWLFAGSALRLASMRDTGWPTGREAAFGGMIFQ